MNEKLSFTSAEFKTAFQKFYQMVKELQVNEEELCEMDESKNCLARFISKRKDQLSAERLAVFQEVHAAMIEERNMKGTLSAYFSSIYGDCCWIEKDMTELEEIIDRLQ